MIQVKEGVYITEEALKEARELRTKPKKINHWPAFMSKMRKSGVKPTEEEQYRMFREFVKVQEKISSEE